MGVKVDDVLLLGAEWEELVELFVVYDLVAEEPVAQLDDGLLWPSNLRQELDLYHLQHFKYDQRLNIRDLLAKVANEGRLTDKVPCLPIVVISECAECPIHKVLNLLDILRRRDAIELLLDVQTILLRRLLLIIVFLQVHLRDLV